MSDRTSKSISTLLAISLLFLSTPLEARSFFTARRTFGVLFLGGSAVMAKRAFDFRRDADDVYELYRIAATADEADDLFRKTQDRDTKSQMAGAISVVMLVAGLRLLLSSGVDDNIPKQGRGLRVNGVRVDLRSDPLSRQMGMALKRDF
jgi:hypothetical protein